MEVERFEEPTDYYRAHNICASCGAQLENEWQPIDTADIKQLEESGDYILACVAGSKIPVPTGYDDGWYAINQCFKDWKPTHWMPLPVPPEVWTQKELDDAAHEAKKLSQFLNSE